MDWIKFGQYLLDNGHIKMPVDQRGCRAPLPKKVADVRQGSSRIKYIEISFEGTSITHILFDEEIAEVEKMFRRENKWGKV